MLASGFRKVFLCIEESGEGGFTAEMIEEIIGWKAIKYIQIKSEEGGSSRTYVFTKMQNECGCTEHKEQSSVWSCQILGRIPFKAKDLVGHLEPPD